MKEERVDCEVGSDGESEWKLRVVTCAVNDVVKCPVSCYIGFGINVSEHGEVVEMGANKDMSGIFTTDLYGEVEDQVKQVLKLISGMTGMKKPD